MGKFFALIRRYRYTVLILLLAGPALGMLVSQRNRASPSRFVPNIQLELFGPFHQGLKKGLGFFQGIWHHYLYLVHAEDENRMLREIVEELKQERTRLLEERSENLRLRSLLGFKQRVPKPLLPARVIGKDLSGWFQTLIIDRGIRDGIAEGMAVLSVQGIVGQVMESSSNYSRVLLITDTNSSVAALVQRTRARGIVEGNGLNGCRLKYLHRSQDVQEGDPVLSSGLDGVYPKGTLIGTIIGVRKKETELFQNVFLRPAVDFPKLEEVVVLCEIPKQREIPTEEEIP